MRTHFASAIRRRLSASRVRKISLAVVVAAVVAAAVLGGLSTRHFVRTDRGLVVVPKRFLALSGTCADVRGWTWDDAQAHPDLQRALLDAGYADVLPEAPPPPPEPTTMERVKAKTQALAEGAASAGSNAWETVKGWAK